MTYSIIFSTLATKQFRLLDKTVQERILILLERIRIRPYDFIEKLVGSSYFKLRVGDYRVILRIENNNLIILVVKLGHRRNIYKSM
ncbi:MAG: type II toxin-antitoxin system RelE/ParE family toxin [Candidatus Aenigmatarchaeota archaeon]